ncbi:MAG: tetratricopeptide repeat protein [Deltaproteobacteria bacterium]|nr:tetratricopeptide repeat protein [Deltaproteobacteria bacterium]PIW86191.1 MAG: hypothetical protein COZ95_00565 [Nitrospirae bacterium CG_4_8_14_3_um_filter_50_41]
MDKNSDTISRPPSPFLAVYHSTPELRLWLLAALIALCVTAVYYPTTHFEFVWDDYQNIVDNPHIRSFSLENLKWMFTTFHMGPYQPLTWVSLSLDYLFWELNPLGYHLTNMLLHSMNGACLFFLILLLLKAHRIHSRLNSAVEGSPAWEVAAALAGALLFALHPLRVESVVWTTERRDVLCGSFFLLSLITYVKTYGLNREPNRLVPSGYLLSLFCFALSLLSKSIAVTLPLLLVILDIYPLKRLQGGLKGIYKKESRRVLLEKIPFLLLSLVIGLAAIRGQALEAQLLNTETFAWWKRLAVMFYGIFYYAYKTLFPFSLAPFYRIQYELQLSNPFILISPAMVMLITAFVFRFRRTYPALLAVWASYVTMLLPVSGLFQSGGHIVADRYSYLPTLGFFVLLGTLFGLLYRGHSEKRWDGKRALVSALLFSAVSGAAAYQTITYMSHWQNSVSLWNLEKKYYPKEPIVYSNMGDYFLREGSYEDVVRIFQEGIQQLPSIVKFYKQMAFGLNKLGRHQRAVEAYHLALQYDPNDYESYYNLGNSYYQLGEVPEAIAAGRRAAELNPNKPEALLSLGAFLHAAGEKDEAISSFQKAIRIKPDYVEAYNNLAGVYAMKGDRSLAEETYRKVIQIKPDYAETYKNMGFFYYSLHMDQQAVEALEKSRSLGETDPNVSNTLAWIFATSSDPAMRDGSKSRKMALDLCKRTAFRVPAFLDSLAAAYAESGDFEQAVEYQTQALKLLPTPNENFMMHLKSYRKGLPWRERQ